MKTCPKCRIEVGGEFSYCPLCQNELSGTNSRLHFPSVTQVRKMSLFFRIQLFVSVAVLLICLFLDFAVGLHGNARWSMIVAVSLVVVQITVRRLIRNYNSGIHYFFFHISAAAAVVLAAFSYCMKFMNFSLSFIYPSVMIALTVLMFVFGLKDGTGNVMPYLLTVIAAGIAAGAVVLIKGISFALLWKISLLISVIVLAGTFVFKGSKALNEVHKRFHI